jgi:hypothetical protein
MIIFNVPIKRDYIIELLEQADLDGITFKLVNQKGMELSFETNIEDETTAMKKAKDLIKSTEIGNVLYFQAKVV